LYDLAAANRDLDFCTGREARSLGERAPAACRDRSPLPELSSEQSATGWQGDNQGKGDPVSHRRDLCCGETECQCWVAWMQHDPQGVDPR
jgi:hypothetical protein